VCGSSVLATIDPLFDDDGAAMVALARRALRYRTYSSHEKVESAIGDGLLQRHDSVVNFLRTGGRHGRTDLAGMQLLARTSYFRKEYAYDGIPLPRESNRSCTTIAYSPAPGRSMDDR